MSTAPAASGSGPTCRRASAGLARRPSPGWHFRAATASCVASLIGIRAAVLGIELGPVEVVVDSESDDRGILGLDSGVVRRRAVDEGRRSSIQAKRADRAAVEALVAWAVEHCPVTDADPAVGPDRGRRRLAGRPASGRGNIACSPRMPHGILERRSGRQRSAKTATNAATPVMRGGPGIVRQQDREHRSECARHCRADHADHARASS